MVTVTDTAVTGSRSKSAAARNRPGSRSSAGEAYRLGGVRSSSAGPAGPKAQQKDGLFIHFETCFRLSSVIR